MGYKHIDLSYLDLMADGDRDMKKTMLGMLLEEPAEEMQLMREHAKNEDWEALHQVSHKMKSTLSFVGNEEMVALNKEIETNARNVAQTEKLQAWTTRLANLFTAAREEIQAAHDAL